MPPSDQRDSGAARGGHARVHAAVAHRRIALRMSSQRDAAVSPSRTVGTVSSRAPRHMATNAWSSDSYASCARTSTVSSIALIV